MVRIEIWRINCTSGYTKGLNKAFFPFPWRCGGKKKWIYFVNRNEWTSISYLVISVKHFESKYIKYGKRCTLKWELHPIPTIHTDSISRPSLLRTPVVSRRSPRKRKLDIDQLKEFFEKDKVESFESFSQDHAPREFNLKRPQKSVQYYRLIFESKTGFFWEFMKVLV